MKSKSIISLIAVLLCAVLLFSACSQGDTTSADAGVVTRVVEAEEQEAKATSITADSISFYDVTDGDYKIKISPIYDRSGKEVVAAYILSVVGKDNKALGEDKFPMLRSIVEASSADNQIKLTKDKKGNYIKIESYADSKGNLIAMKDVNDLNSNGNKDEYIKLRSITNKQGSTHYLATLDTVEVVKENNKTYVVQNGKKTEVHVVNAKNKSVQSAVEQQTASKKEKEQIKKKKKKVTTTKKKSNADKSGNKSDNNGKNPGGNSDSDNNSDSGNSSSGDFVADTNDKTKAYDQIILQKNGKAKTGSKKVTCSSNEVKITGGGDYLIVSEAGTWHGVIKLQLKNTEEAELRFEDVNISYNSGSVIQLIDTTESAERSFLEGEAAATTSADDALNDAMDDSSDRKGAPDVSLSFPSGTSSHFESSSNASTGVIYNEAKLTIKGNGTLSVSATTNTNNAISSSKALTVKNANVKLQTAAYGATSGIGGSRGIFSYGKVNVESGTLTIQSNGDAIRCTRFSQEGGTLNATSSACDGIDSESSIDISGGNANVTAIQKSSFKVRRVNLQERYDNGERVNRNDLVRSDKGDGFHISGGTVIGESKKVSDYNMKPKQNTVVCRTVKKTKGSTSETKAPVKWNMGGVKSSNACVKFLYSSSGLSEKNYSVKVNNKTPNPEPTWKWSNGLGSCYVPYSNVK